MRIGKNVIANFQINDSAFVNVKNKNKLGKFVFMPNYYWLNNSYYNKGYKHIKDDYGNSVRPQSLNNGDYSYIEGLYGFALQFHKRNLRGQIKEHQTIIVIDECQELFNARTWNRKDRLLWCSFFRQHRKYGYDVYLISQDDSVIDRQIRNIIEYEVEHRCINNFKLTGKVLGLLCGGKLFIAITRWYMKGKKNEKIDSELFIGKKRYYEFYDSYATFSGSS